MKNLVKEPLLHFFMLGALLFALYLSVSNDEAQPNTIYVTQQVIDNLKAQHSQTWQRTPTADELEQLVQGWLREEILFREGMAMGLAENDPIVRRRVSQKMTYLAETALPAEPTDSQLRLWLDNHPDDYLIQPRYSFRQVFLNPDHYDEPLTEVADKLLPRLKSGEGGITGDSRLLPQTFDGVTAYEVQRRFGDAFQSNLGLLPVGEWSGPVVSGLGAHLVLLTAHSPARPAVLAEVRQAVARDWLNAQAKQVQQQLYESLRGRYSVEYAVDDRMFSDREPEAE
ncbi:peptidylprolyl isomerase [Marinobacter zhejiangensis]|uniref:PPIC-type PPIASE domain-containing protein n=1 Tax=Marinobacter zhejiangensis TaxID=488535 RepID=A0A1I4P1P4_9GAMM|nr:peptidylprolyl isomerase [Marinobacter zhejiangensis]SFM21585.1 PPIC-type PPIASE domain-containing protein [Marinobacter zhejiangensis]